MTVPEIRFDERGLVPCVIQDWTSGEVLTLAYMNAEALRLTLETSEIHLHSRSRDELWRKGATSGNVQRLRQLRYDCDADAIVALVDPAGPACHTGQRSCFYRDYAGSADPSGRGGVHMTRAAQPAIRAGTASMMAVEGSGAVPAGT